MCDVCAQGWRVEATHLRTGVVKAVIHPTSARWDEQYSRPGHAALSGSVVGPSASDVWIRSTGLYISRVLPDGTRDGRFGGYVNAFKPDPDRPDIFNMGLQAMDEFLFHRLLADDDEGLAYATPGYVDPETPGPGREQTLIALDLFNLAVTGNGLLPLSATAGPSTQLRVRSWTAQDFKNLGEAIQEIVDDANGVTYRVSHHFFENPARWETRIRFEDEQNIDRGLVIRDGIEAWQTGLEVDGREQGSRVYGVGATAEDGTQMFAIAYDSDAELPEFQKTVAWKDVVVPETLDEYTVGAVTRFRDPATTVTCTLVGLTDVPPADCQTGDIISPDVGYGLFTFRGQKARVTGQSWVLDGERPVTRMLALDPLIRPSLSVKLQVPAKAPVPQTPEQETDPPPETPIDPPAPALPSQVFDLTNWKLTLAIGKEGSPTEIKQPALASYTHPEFFHTVDGPGVLFRVPQDGVTTPNSKNTRTELREMRNGGKDNASWSSGTMEAVLAFTELPPGKPHVVGMQIHDKDDDVTVLRLEGTDLWTTNGDNTHGKKIMSGYQLGTFIKVKVVAGGGTIRWFLNDTEVASLSKSISGGYFKAGAYQQAGNSGDGFGEVIFKSLVVTH